MRPTLHLPDNVLPRDVHTCGKRHRADQPCQPSSDSTAHAQTAHRAKAGGMKGKREMVPYESVGVPYSLDSPN